MQSRIITLLPSSDADDLRCTDGELLGADYLFAPTSPSGQPSSPGPSDPSDADGEVTLRFSLESARPFPSGARFLAMHRPPGQERPNAVVQLASGYLAFDTPDTDPVFWQYISSAPVGEVVKATAVGPWLVVLTSSALLFARWEGTAYSALEPAPASPSSGVMARSRALPPYSALDSELPVITASAALAGGDSEAAVLDWLAGRSFQCSRATQLNVVSAVREAFRSFLAAVSRAGLFFSPVMAAVSRSLPDGALWGLSTPSLVGPSGAVSLEVMEAGVTDGFLYLSLRVSRLPFSVELADGASSGYGGFPPCLIVRSDARDVVPDSVSAPVWLSSSVRGFRVEAVQLTPADFSPFPAVARNIDDFGLPESIFSIGGRLIATLPSRGGYAVIPSVPEVPFISAAAFVSAPAAVLPSAPLYLSDSLQSASSGLHPLYAFCADGIHLIRPLATGCFGDSRLVSRHGAAGPDAFAPLPDGTAFISPAGVMRLSGTSVSCLSLPSRGFPEGEDFSSSRRLLFLYKENMLLLYRPDVAGILAYDFAASAWRPMEGFAGERHYAWPSAWVRQSSRFGPAEALTVSSAAPPAGARASSLEGLTTRPIKLTDAFSFKRLHEVRALWPDGSVCPFRVYGALRPGRWFFLGLSLSGRMRLRGSAWRLFKIESFAIKNENSYLLPQFFINFAT